MEKICIDKERLNNLMDFLMRQIAYSPIKNIELEYTLEELISMYKEGDSWE